jgi:hypothetical protein
MNKQFMIVCFVKEKLDIVNFIHDGFHSNKSVIQNQFLLFTTHVYYRSIVIDLCTLFSAKNVQKNNFHRLYCNPAVAQCFSQNRAEEIKLLLLTHVADIKVIEALRDKEYAHFDFTEDTISFSLEKIDILNSLFSTAKKILEVCGANEGTQFDLSLGDYRQSLEQFLAATNVVTTKPDHKTFFIG